MECDFCGAEMHEIGKEKDGTTSFKLCIYRCPICGYSEWV